MAKTARRKRATTQTDIPKQILERLPKDRLLLYAHLWELETWLREMVYVELIARYGSDWKAHIEGDPERAQESDGRLRHMPTRERLSISYILFSQLRQTIAKQWDLFSEYLPPEDIWTAKLTEVGQIRNRVAHFRRGHSDDINRVRQLLRDLDRGLWSFCTSYNDTLPIIPVKDDPVALEFAEFDPFPWGEIEPNTYARFGHAPPNLVMSVTVELLRRPWLTTDKPVGSVIGIEGYLYDVRLGARDNREFDYRRFLDSTKRLHDRICHICLDSGGDGIRVTMPSVGGVDLIVPTLNKFVEAARNTLHRKTISISFTDIPEYTMATTKAVDDLSMQWPEYVLGPSNPLTFLDPDMPCDFFGLS